ncbi:MAG: transglutaminase-like domain-containing protein [Myxococcota bacterium]
MDERTEQAKDAPRPEDCLGPGRYVDSDHPAVVAWAREVTEGAEDDVEAAVRLYEAVRDGVRYDPYRIDLTPRYFTASATLELGRGFCVNKAALLAAGARAVGIPARLGFADVRNHLTSDKLKRLMGTDVFAWHGYTELYLEGRWVKATPAFNRSLCEHAGVALLEFDGRSDSIYQPHDLRGRRHMEYVRYRGEYADVPFERIVESWHEIYGWTPEDLRRVSGGGDFERDARAE